MIKESNVKNKTKESNLSYTISRICFFVCLFSAGSAALNENMALTVFNLGCAAFCWFNR